MGHLNNILHYHSAAARGPALLGALINQATMLSGSIILILGTLTVVGMIISDIMLVILDPRIRLTGSG